MYIWSSVYEYECAILQPLHMSVILLLCTGRIHTRLLLCTGRIHSRLPNQSSGNKSPTTSSRAQSNQRRIWVKIRAWLSQAYYWLKQVHYQLKQVAGTGCHQIPYCRWYSSHASYWSPALCVSLHFSLRTNAKTQQQRLQPGDNGGKACISSPGATISQPTMMNPPQQQISAKE